MNFDDHKLDDYLLPDAEALDELSLFDEDMPVAESEVAPPREEWPQL